MTPETTLPHCLAFLASDRRFVGWRWKFRGMNKPTKVPYQVNGEPAKSNDPATWATLAEVEAARQSQRFDGVGIQLLNLPGCAALDLDNVRDPETGDVLPWARQLVEACGSYAEITPSGTGLRIIGAVTHSHAPMHTKRPHPEGGEVEFFVQPNTGRFITLTGNKLDAAPDRLALIETQIASVHADVAPQPTPQLELTPAEATADVPDVSLVDDEQAVTFVRASDANRRNWDGEGVSDQSRAFGAVVGALALVGCSREQARRLALTSPLVVNGPPHSRGSRADKSAWDFDRIWPAAARRGAQERQEQAARTEHGRQAWAGVQAVNGQPLAGRNAAQGQLPFSVEIGPGLENDMTLDFVIDHWLPRKSPILIAGMGSSGKSSLVAAWCAEAERRGVATLWVSSEENTAWVRTRHAKAGGTYDNIGTLSLMPTARDPETGQVTATTFGIYAHLNAAIIDAKQRVKMPLGIVVLDAVSALVDWKKGESPNDDASVKRAIGYLMGLAETHDVSIVMIHHFNKTQAASYDPNRVTGATAWVNTPRLAFAVVKDDASDTGFDNFVQVIKTNLGMRFGASFTTFPVHTLATYTDGAPDTVLCSARINGGIVWGDRDVKLLVNNGDDPDAETKATRRKTFDNKVMHVAEAVRNGAANRLAIASFLASLGVSGVTQNQWIKIDAELQDKYGIDVTTLAHNKYEYRLRSQNSPQLAPP